MPRFNYLTQEEMDILSKRRGSPEVLRPYVEFASTLEEGEVGELILNEGEEKRTAKRRLSVAATATGHVIKWIRPLDPRNLFKVVR